MSAAWARGMVRVSAASAAGDHNATIQQSPSGRDGGKERFRRMRGAITDEACEIYRNRGEAAISVKRASALSVMGLLVVVGWAGR